MITKEETLELYKQLVRKNGRYRQMCVYRSELFELMTEITKFVYNDSKKDTIYQEIADMIICTEQFVMYNFQDKLTYTIDTANIVSDFREIFREIVDGKLFVKDSVNRGMNITTGFASNRSRETSIMDSIEFNFRKIHDFLSVAVNVGPTNDNNIILRDSILQQSPEEFDEIVKSMGEYCNDVLSFLTSIIDLLVSFDAYNHEYVKLNYEYKLSRLKIRFLDNKYI